MPLNHVDFKAYSGVGKMLAFKRTPATGVIAGGGYDFGESPVVKFGRKGGNVEMKTTRTPDRGTAFRMAQEMGGDVEIQVKTLTPFVESLIHGGSWSETAAAAAVVGWSAPAGLEAGMVIKLPHLNVSAVTVTDAASKVLPVGQYELEPNGGTIRLINITAGAPYTQPFRVNYTPGATKVLSAFGASLTDEYTLQFNGVNAWNAEPKVIQLYRVMFDVEGSDDWVQQEATFGMWTIKGVLLRDSTRLASAVGGQYYSVAGL